MEKAHSQLQISDRAHGYSKVKGSGYGVEKAKFQLEEQHSENEVRIKGGRAEYVHTDKPYICRKQSASLLE